MNLDNFLCKLLDVFLHLNAKYLDSDKAAKLYNYVYTPVVQMLLPFMKEYDGSEDNKLAEILHNCRVILSDNFEISNPIHIKRINRIIDDNLKFKNCTLFSKHQKKKYENGTEEYRLRKDKEFRKTVFESFIHDLLIEYNSLRKTVGIKKLTVLQMVNLDQVEYNNVMDYVKFVLAILAVILVFLLLSCFPVIVKLIYSVLTALNLIQ